MPPIPPMVDVTCTALTTAKRFLGGREMCVIFLYEDRRYASIQYTVLTEADSMCCRSKAGINVLV